MPLASGKCFFDGEFEISFSCLCFICGNGRVSDLSSHGKADTQARLQRRVGQSGSGPRCCRGLVSLVQQRVSEHLPGVAVS